MKTIWKATMYAAILATVHFSFAGLQPAQISSAQNVAPARAIGTVQSITGTIFTMKTDQGVSYTVTVPGDAKVLRLEPGQTSLSSATPLDFSNVAIGDRVLASGNPGSGANTIMASTIVAIKKADVTAKQQQDLQDWTRRGTGGLVASVDPTADTVSLKVSAAAGTTKPVTVHISKTTQILRYAPNSVKFDDAKPSTLDAVKPGDQLLARGTRSEDGSDVTAEAIVSGNFRNLSGTLLSVNPAENILTLKDVATKATFTVKITPDTQVRKLPAQAAAMLAARMKSASGAGAAGGAAGGDQGGAGGRGAAGAGGYGGRGGGRGFGGGGGGGDLSQVIARAPTVTLAELQKGDAVMIVSTAGDGSNQVSAIQLVAGVEAILEASPTASMNLPAWDVGGGGGGGDQ
jgi:hypothetical protein